MINKYRNIIVLTNFIGEPLNIPGTDSNDQLWVQGPHYAENFSALSDT